MKFSKFFASAVAVSMLASVAAVGVSAADKATFGYAVDNGEASVISASKEGESKYVAVADKSDNGETVSGVAAFALKDLDLDIVDVPDTLKADKLSPVSFLTKADIDAYLTTVLEVSDEELDKAFSEIDPEKATAEDFEMAALGAVAQKVVAYAANTVEFQGKKDWNGNEDELEPGAEVLGNVYNTVKGEAEGLSIEDFIVNLYLYEDTAAIVRADGEDTLTKMSDKSYANFKKWVETLPFNELTLVGSEESPVAEYAKTNEIRGLAYDVLGDANHDGKFNIRDCAFIANKLANQKNDELHKPCADYNRDDVPNIRDAAAMARAIAQKAVK